MPKCRNCGESIDIDQTRNFNGLCPSCIRLQQTRVPLKTLWRTGPGEGLGLMGMGFICLIFGLLMLIYDDPTYLETQITIYGLVAIGFGILLIIIGFIVFKSRMAALN